MDWIISSWIHVLLYHTKLCKYNPLPSWKYIGSLYWLKYNDCIKDRNTSLIRFAKLVKILRKTWSNYSFETNFKKIVNVCNTLRTERQFFNCRRFGKKRNRACWLMVQECVWQWDSFPFEKGSLKNTLTKPDEQRTVVVQTPEKHLSLYSHSPSCVRLWQLSGDRTSAPPVSHAKWIDPYRNVFGHVSMTGDFFNANKHCLGKINQPSKVCYRTPGAKKRGHPRFFSKYLQPLKFSCLLNIF